MRLATKNAELDRRLMEAERQPRTEVEWSDHGLELTFCINRNVHRLLEHISLRQASCIVALPDRETVL